VAGRTIQDQQSAPVEGPRPVGLGDQTISIGQKGNKRAGSGCPEAASSARREFGGLAIVSSELIEDDGSTAEVEWVPLAMDEPPAPRLRWQLRGTLHYPAR
jgi:hypothetical protein